MARDEILKSLPRRPWLAGADPGPAELKINAIEFPEASPWLLLRRGIQWTISLWMYAIARVRDRLSGNTSLSRQGQRLRELFERAGGTGTKVGQQLAIRVDFLPYAVCRELNKLLDSVPAFPLEQAIERIEESLGKPVSEIFAHIEPKPIGSASIACVWSATLLTGERVAVKVQRPGIEKLFIADIELVAKFTRLIEALGIVRQDFLQNLRNEMLDMFVTELNFVQEANYQIMFRRLAKQDKLNWVTAPKVYVNYSSASVLTTEFIEGYEATRLLDAFETDDVDLLDELHSHDIDPQVVGSRLLSLSYWSRLENFFFHSDPHPGNIFVLPGNKLVLIDFGSCGVNPSDMSAGEFELVRRFVEGDMAGATNAALVVQAPFPNIDIARYSRVVQRVLWKRYLDMKSVDAKWWERTTASLWIATIEVTRQFQVPVNINILRLIRATLLYDTLAFRLNPDIDFIKAFQNWQKDARKRGRRKVLREAWRVAKRRDAHIMSQLGDLKENMERGVFWANRFVNNLPKRFTAVAGQTAYLFSMMLRLGLSYALMVLLGGVGIMLYFAWFSSDDIHGHEESFLNALETAVTSPIFIIVASLMTLEALSHVQKKLGETDEES